MTLPTVAVMSTGGTIASTESQTGATPSKSGEGLIAAVPALDRYADVVVEELERVLSFHMDFATLAEMARRIRSLAARGVDGVVITHGTDTMEETAYYLDLVLECDCPVVLTGAQLRADDVGFDGNRNVVLAVRAASHDFFRGEGGVYVAFGEEVHAARDVTKGHTSALSTFVSPDKCPVARFTDRGIRTHRRAGSHSISVDSLETTKVVPMIKSGCGVGGQQVVDARNRGVDGIVVEGTGLGNTTSAIGDAVDSAIADDVPVVITSRCHGGSVAPVYGTPGGGARLHESGAIFGSDLPAQKARIKLLLLLESVGTAREDLRTAFEE